VFNIISYEQQLDMKLVYDVAHNIAKVERYKIDGEGMRDLVIHRNGTTRACRHGRSPCKIP
jgi:tRNA-splicing ligase RtcB (3'-phosphate/5'-hydroxy nucleic acid ligase)